MNVNKEPIQLKIIIKMVYADNDLAIELAGYIAGK